MSSSNLVRWGGLAATLAGALFVAADLMSLSISPKFPSSVSLTSEPYAIQSVLKLIGAALLLLGLSGLHARQAWSAGPLGTAGALAAFSGTALVVGSFWATAFFAPAMATMDPVAFDAGEGPPGRLAGAKKAVAQKEPTASAVPEKAARAPAVPGAPAASAWRACSPESPSRSNAAAMSFSTDCMA